MRKNLGILALNIKENLRTVLSEVFEENGFEMIVATSGEVAMVAFERNPFPLVIADIGSWESAMTEIFQKIRLHDPETQIIIITTDTTLETAVSAIRSDTYDYLFKPIQDLELGSASTKRAIEKFRLIAENKRLLKKHKKQNGKLAKANKILKELSNLDGLTGLNNHRYFKEALKVELQRSVRHERTLYLLFIDIDFFKNSNDKNGHQQGDKLLQDLAKILKKRLRESDLFARYGGEEFVVILPETSKEGATNAAEDLRCPVLNFPFPGRKSQPVGKVALRIGISTFLEDGSTDSSALIKYADYAPYEAKNNGRNGVCTSVASIH
jgi:diguanylate cyclase (GGDEF)-like protein